MTPNEIFIAVVGALWILGTPGYLMMECWLGEDHVIKRGSFIAAPFIGWTAPWVLMCIIVVLGPLALISYGFEQTYKFVRPTTSPKPFTSFEKWLEEPALSCRRKL